ncbi:MAG: phosphoglycerate kinase [Elusimicrobia bacterium]|nr:phosphoglycerate kinase [Elusimicrobiota bacterium]
MAEKTALRLRRIQDLDLRGKRVLVRVDYNVPLKDGKVADATRIRETLPTLKHLIEAQARIVLISHLGRPKGAPESKYSLYPAARELETLLKVPVLFATDCVGAEAEKVVGRLAAGQVALLENLRFHPGEERNDPAFAAKLAEHGDVFIQEAFGALHRAHASTAGIPGRIPGGVGFLVQKELEFLDRVIGNPERPFLAILGGAKVSDKIGVIHKLLERVDTLVIGGGMAYTFMLAQGMAVGRSLVEKEKVAEAQALIEKACNKGVECLLPADHLIVSEIKEGAEAEVTQGMAIPGEKIGVDIGPRSLEFFAEEIRTARTIFWNGPMGIFEMEAFSKGTMHLAEQMARATQSGATTIVGGGDSLAALNKAGVAGQISHCSTGGGASLELIEGKVLPGLLALSLVE